ncbi:MAG: amidohydrolase family protein [Planctomycetota bacterium]
MPPAPDAHFGRLCEAHAHVFQHGRSLGMIDLSACGSAADLLDRFAERSADGGELLGHGARPEAWADPEWPTPEAFERATGDGPAVAWCFDYHALLANRAALALAGYADDSPDPSGGQLGRDADGRLTGLAYESAAIAVWEALPEPAASDRSLLLERSLSALAALGFAEVHDLKAQPWLGEAWRALLESGRTAVRGTLWLLMKDLGGVAAARSAWEGDDLRLGGGKIFVDGTLNSRTAWMLHPYADGHGNHPAGMALMSVEEIAAAVRTCDALGVPMAAHAIGDGAVRAVIDALELVRPRTRGWRIEHAELIDEADTLRLVRLTDEIGLIVSVQPCHLLPDIEALHRALPDRLGRVLPLRELIDAGLVPGEYLVFGSDVPIVRADPGDSVQAAVHRRREGMPAADAIAPEQAVTEAEAWACFRGGPASV